jgi:hypothetical protein
MPPQLNFTEMSRHNLRKFRLTEKDLEFLAETRSPEVSDKWRLKQVLREDEDFRNAFISNEKIFRRLMDDDQILIKISPTLFFEILLRKAAQDFSRVSYTLEKSLTMSIPVFDSGDLVELLERESLLIYLADMLSSFTRIESYTFSIRIGERIWKKIRFNDLDIVSLMAFCEAVDEELRMGIYKRIADICLFILGIFPDYIEHDFRYPVSGTVRPQLGKYRRISTEEYEKAGCKFYKMAAEHRSAEEIELAEVFWDLHENFQKATKLLNHIADYYLRYKRDALLSLKIKNEIL